MTTVRMWTWIQVAVALVAVLSFAIMAAEPPTEEVNRKPSTYAPAKDLESQVQFFLDRIKDDLKDESEYGEESVKRVVRDANTLAVLALVLGKHDEANRFQSSAATLLENALKLAEKSQDYKEARSAYAKLVESTNRHEWLDRIGVEKCREHCRSDEPGSEPQYETARASAERWNGLRSCRDEAAGLAATLAAIAQVSMFDDSYCSDQADRADWIELCGLMRDAAYDINQAVHRGDREAAVSGLKPLTRTCDDCHEQFKD